MNGRVLPFCVTCQLNPPLGSMARTISVSAAGSACHVPAIEASWGGVVSDAAAPEALVSPEGAAACSFGGSS